MDRIKLNRILNRWNPWWVGQKIKLPEFRRKEYVNLRKEADDTKVSVITGPRQTGKTTLMYQLISELITEEIKPQRLLYLLLDDLMDELQNKEVSLREILEVWTEDILNESLTEGWKYVFFDEIQLYHNWSREIKSLQQQQYPIKFFISGSSSVDILKGASESLAGRMLRTVVMPLGFREILNFHLQDEEIKGKIAAAGSAVTASLIEAVTKNQPQIFFEQAGKLQKLILPVEDKIRIQLNKYLQKGGYPEIALTDLDNFQSFARLKNYLDSVIHKDFVNFFKVRDTKTLERILRIAAKNTSQIISGRSLAKDLGISINTARNHLGFLEAAFLVLTSALFSGSMAKKMRRPHKLYLIDIGLGNALVGYDDNDRGKITETLVHNHLEFLGISNPLYKFDLAYWKEDYEIDLVLSAGKHCLPIEVKSTKNEITKGMSSFLGKLNNWGLVVAGEFKKEGKVIFMPLHLFLLMG